jgi:NAD(P)H-hydrate epimerase
VKVLTSAQMREVDRLTTERYGIPGLQLMENAAIAVVDSIEKRLGGLEGKRGLVICGKGNNGGDGAAAARHFQLRGARIDLILLGKLEDTRGDARRNFELARAISSGQRDRFIFVETPDEDEFDQITLPLLPGDEPAFWAFTKGINIARATPYPIPMPPTPGVNYDFAIDAIFGTGLARPASGLFERAIDFLAKARSHGIPVVSVDIPSGIASDSPNLIGPAVRADLTVTLTAPKPASVLPPACHYGGDLIVSSIGSPDQLIEEAGSNLDLVEPRMIESWLARSRRGPDANKGDVGKVLIVAGSRGKTGAACLSGLSAMRSGTGLVTVATAASSQPVVASQIAVECMTEPLPETGSGSVSLEALHDVLQLAGQRDVLAIGPGLGASSDSTRELVRGIVLNRSVPLVIDADGLNSLAPWPESLKGTPDLPMILTPHPGEMARLTGETIPRVVSSRVEIARRFAVQHSVILVLKGSRTIVAATDGQVYVSPTGNSGMATGGTGDVLTGIIAGLLAQKPEDHLGATITAVYIHGLAGDIAARRLGTRAMIASDIIAALGEAFIQAGGPQERPSQ